MPHSIRWRSIDTNKVFEPGTDDRQCPVIAAMTRHLVVCFCGGTARVREAQE